MELWPALLPAPTVAFSGSTESSVARTQMESGRFRQRPRFTSELRTYRASWELSDFQFGFFQAWFLRKLSNGADKFTINLPTGGEGMAKAVNASFVEGKYNYSHNRGAVLWWTVSATLEVEEAEVWSEEIYDAILVLGDPRLYEAEANDLHRILNELLPSYF